MLVTSRYRALLTTPGFSSLLVSSVLGRLPSGMFSLVILLFVHAQTGSFLIAGLAVGAFTLTGAVVSPLLGALVDRLGQTRVLVSCAAGQAALLVAFIFVIESSVSVIATALTAAAAGALLPPVSGCVRALWSQAAPDAEALEAAYSLDAITQEVIYTAGPLLAGSVAVLISPAAAVLLSAAIALVGTLSFASCRFSRAWRVEVQMRRAGSAISSQGLRVLLVSALFAGAVVGSVEVGLPALAVSLGARGIAGLLLALFSLGSMAGGLLYSARVWHATVAQRYSTVLLAVEFLVAPLALTDSLPWALLFSFVAGLGVAPMLSCQFSLVGLLAPRGNTTEAFAWHRGMTVAGIAMGTAVGGFLVDHVAANAPFALACSGAALACVIALPRRGQIAPQRLSVDDESTVAEGYA